MKADPKAESAAPRSSKRKMIAIALAGVLILGVAGGAAWYLTRPKADGATPEVSKAEKPEFVVIDQFVVNLQSEGSDQYLQTNMTLQLGSPEQVDVIKTNMPLVRNRILLLLSSKQATELNSTEGKKALAAEIVTAINAPFVAKGPKQEVRDVLFTSFIIQ